MFPLNLPNFLTLVRILLVPVLVVALTVEIPHGQALAAAAFVIASLTDGLDGYIARSRESVTTFGKVMDPVADKLLIAAALLALVSLDKLAAWVAMIIIAREFAVSGLRIAAGAQGVVIPASNLGKVKTIVQSAAVLALIAAPEHDAPVGARPRLRDGADDRRVGRGLLHQLPPPPRGAVGRARGARAVHPEDRRRRLAPLLAGAVGRRQPLEQLVARGAAQVQRPVEQLAVGLEHREQHVERARALGPALASELASAIGDRLDDVRPERRPARRRVAERLRAGEQRALAHAERL